MNPQAHANGTRHAPWLRMSGGRAERRSPKRSRLVGLAWLSLALALALVVYLWMQPQQEPADSAPGDGAGHQRSTDGATAAPAPPVQTTPPPATSAETGVDSAALGQPRRMRSRSRREHSHKNAPAARQAAAPPAQATRGTARPEASHYGRSNEGQVQIATQVPQGTAQNTEQLLQTAEGKLRKVTRQLSDGEQAMLRQARNYITQSRSASQDGDLERAYNLAMKANLLSGELAK